MRERLSHLIGAQVVSKLILGTFHSICRRYLVAYGHLIGLKKGFGIADSNDSLVIIKVCFLLSSVSSLSCCTWGV
jgi:DNA helicase II / ATP-dependent DNA helicase PcrA